MQATLTFDLPEEREGHLWAVHACDLASAIIDLDNKLRSWAKHGCPHKNTDGAVEELRLMLQEVLPVAYGEA